VRLRRTKKHSLPRIIEMIRESIIGGSMKLEVGMEAPDFTLPSHLDKAVTLSDLRGKNVVLAFFPEAWTPI